MSRVIATALALWLTWLYGIRYAATRGYCAYCHAQLEPPPKNLDHWRTCPTHPARTELERLQRDNDDLRDDLREVIG